MEMEVSSPPYYYLSLDIFSFLAPFLVNPRDGCDVLKIPAGQLFVKILRPANSVHHTDESLMPFSSPV